MQSNQPDFFAKEFLGRCSVKFLVWRVLGLGDWLLLTYDAGDFFGRGYFYEWGSTWGGRCFLGVHSKNGGGIWGYAAVLCAVNPWCGGWDAAVSSLALRWQLQMARSM